jgi:hypothetical protein
MMTNSTPNHACEIVITIVLKIPIYIEPVVLEIPPICDAAAHGTMDAIAKPVVTTSTPNQPQKPSKLMPIKALSLLLLASASAVAFYVLASVSLGKLCPDLFCLSWRSLRVVRISPKQNYSNFHLQF